MLESAETAETEEESKDCCDMLDDLVQSLIIYGKNTIQIPNEKFMYLLFF